MNPFEKTKLGLRYFPIAPVVMRYKNLPITAYVARYQNKLLREALRLIVGNEHMSALVLVMLLAFRTRKNTGFVAGGSWDFAMAITDRYRKLGGSLRLKARVASIQVRATAPRRAYAPAAISCRRTRWFRAPTATPPSSKCWTANFWTAKSGFFTSIAGLFRPSCRFRLA